MIRVKNLLRSMMGFVNRLCVVLVFVGLICGKVMASEPHFDLSKKDAKNFCLELNKITDQCYYNRDISKSKQFDLLKCGNVFLRRTEVDFSLYDEGGGSAFLILDEKGHYIGYNVSVGTGEIVAGIPITNNGGYYVGDSFGEDDDGKYLTHIPYSLVKKHKKQLEDSKIVIKVEACYIKEIKIKN